MSSEEQILMLDILKVLYRYSDFKENKQMTQKEIIDTLTKDYGYKDLYKRRWTVKDNIERLVYYFRNDKVDCLDDNDHKLGRILYKARFRNIPNKKAEKDKREPKMKEIAVLSDFAYCHPFSHAELRLIIDSILFSRQIPNSQREQLIKKLESVTSDHFNSRLDNIRTMSANEPVNDELFDNIRVLDQAINEYKQVAFTYNHYTVDQANSLVLEPRKTDKGKERTYIINPYQMVASNGRYYLICNNDYFHNLSHYRLDRITDIKMLKTKRKPLRKLKGVGERIDLSRYMAEHIYMFGGKSISVSLKIEKGAIGEFIDWFGTDTIEFSKQTEVDVTARVTVNREAMRKWALQYALHVTVLSPPDLVEDIKADIRKALENYE